MEFLIEIGPLRIPVSAAIANAVARVFGPKPVRTFTPQGGGLKGLSRRRLGVIRGG
jgi:hypothetical protein